MTESLRLKGSANWIFRKRVRQTLTEGAVSPQGDWSYNGHEETDSTGMGSPRRGGTGAAKPGFRKAKRFSNRNTG